MSLSRHRPAISRLISLHHSRRLLYARSCRFLSSSSSSHSDVGNTGAGCGDGEGQGEGGESKAMTEAEARRDAYNQLENLDFMKAAKILFTVPPKRKKFGLDFHLVQFFFACLPSLAVYLVAQYARQDMEKFEEEMEKKNKKKVEDEQMVKRAELESIEKDSDQKLTKVMERLDAIEEVVKEIVHDKNKSPNSSSPSKPAEQNPGSRNK